MGYELKQSDIFDFAESIGAETRQKGDELEFRYCPYCKGDGSGYHKDEWTFSINLYKGVFKCLRASCDHHGHFVELCRDFDFRLDFEQPKIFRQLPQKEKPVSRDEAVTYMKTRGISEETTKKYHVTVKKDNPKILVFPFYDETGKLIFIKYRKTDFRRGIDSNKEWSEKDTMPILFGMDQCVGFDRLVITEGQIDSMSVAEAGIPNAVSVPTGANGFTWFSYNYHWITQFKEIVVFGDCESSGITLIDGLSARLPKDITIKCVRRKDYLGEKDANDILRKYGAKAVRYCVENAEVPKLDNVKQLADVKSIDINKIEKIRTGVYELDRCIRGFAMGQLVILTGKRGEGKSTFMSQLVCEALNQNKNVFVYSGELADYHFKNWLDLQLAGDKYVSEFTDQFDAPEYSIPDDVRGTINTWYRNRAYIYDNNYLVDGDEFESLPDTVEKVIKQYNIQMVCIDNLMTAMEAVSEQSNLYLAQSNFVGRLKAIAMKYSIVIVLVAHPRKSSAKDMMDDNDLVAGSSDITNKADIVLKYSRNTNEDFNCDGLIKVTKNRIMGALKISDSDAVRVSYSVKSKRVTGNNPLDYNQRYGWEKLVGFKTEAIPEKVDQAEELPF